MAIASAWKMARVAPARSTRSRFFPPWSSPRFLHRRPCPQPGDGPYTRGVSAEGSGVLGAAETLHSGLRLPRRNARQGRLLSRAWESKTMNKHLSQLLAMGLLAALGLTLFIHVLATADNSRGGNWGIEADSQQGYFAYKPELEEGDHFRINWEWATGSFRPVFAGGDFYFVGGGGGFAL